MKRVEQKDKTNQVQTAINRIKVLFEILLMGGISFFLIGTHEHFYQVEKDYSFYKAVFISILLIILIRNISFKEIRVIVSLSICVLGIIVFIVFKGIRVDRYGELYTKSLRLLTVNWGLFVFVLTDVFRKETILLLKNMLKNPFFYFTLLTCILISLFGRNYLPFICPIFLLFLTEIRKEKWIELVDCLALGFFLAFATYFSVSIIKRPFEYDITGRYIGRFLNNCELGMTCSGAAVSVLYLILRWFRSKHKIIFQLIILMFMTAFTVFSLWIVRGRTGEAGLLLCLVFSVVFLHGKKPISTIKRSGVLIGLTIVGVVVYILLANYLQSKIVNGDLQYSDLSYSMAHIAGSAMKDTSYGTFKPNSLLNAIDILSAQRLGTWYELGVQIIPFGQIPEADLATHSTYLYWLVRYGAIPGTITIVWFLLYGIFACIRSVKNDKTSMFTLMWWAYCAGIFIPANEYWVAPGGFILLFLMYPLINGIESEKVNER